MAHCPNCERLTLILAKTGDALSAEQHAKAAEAKMHGAMMQQQLEFDAMGRREDRFKDALDKIARLKKASATRLRGIAAEALLPDPEEED